MKPDAAPRVPIEAPGCWWSCDTSALFNALRSGPEGLPSREAARRYRQLAAGTAHGGQKAEWPRLLARQFASPLVLILVFGALVSLALREGTEAAIILVIVCGSALLGFSQELRASNAMAKLRRRLAIQARVWRDGSEHPVPTSHVVPGDVVLLAAGNLVPADAVLLEAKDFLVTESSLTGESLPVEKQPGVVPPDTPLVQRTNCVFLGSSVRSGTARALVTATGGATAFGAIAARIARRAPETEFARGVRQFGELLLRVMVLMVLLVIGANQWLGRPMVESLLFAVALAVGLSPELLPAIVSVTLSRGAHAMARRGVIVRRLEAIENLGSIDVLCTDKTGTLTVGVVALHAAVGPDGEASPRVRQLAFVNAALETGIANPLDAAIVADGNNERLTSDGWRKIDEIPYDFQRRRLTIVAVEAQAAAPGAVVVTKGAFDNVLDVCTQVAAPGQPVALEAPMREVLRGFFRKQSELGFRVLAVATRGVAERTAYTAADESP